MATKAQGQWRVGYTISGKSPEIRTGIEGASQTFKKGTGLFMSASQRLLRFGVGAFGAGDVGLGIAGIACKDGQNASNSTTETEYYVANDDTVFVANVINRLTATAANNTISITHVGSVAGASVNGTRSYIPINMAAATSSLVMVRGRADGTAFGDIYGEVYFQFLRPLCVWAK